jgi:putative ABC transport system substrate-binding protein
MLTESWLGQRMQFGQLKRREFIMLLGGAAAAWPLAAHARQPVLPTIGFLSVASPEAFGAYVTAFRQGLGQVGYFEGRNVSIEFRWARGQYDRFATLASELVGQRVAIIAANGGARSALAAKAATINIPIVFTFGDGDPVALNGRGDSHQIARLSVKLITQCAIVPRRPERDPRRGWVVT